MGVRVSWKGVKNLGRRSCVEAMVVWLVALFVCRVVGKGV